MARVAGLPVESVRALRATASARWAHAVHERRTRLAERGAALSGPLHDAIHATEDDALRRTLVNLRRQVFNNKQPADYPGALAAAEALGGPAGRDLTAWLRDRNRLEEFLGSGPYLVRSELARTREELRRIAAGPRLREGLLLASPSLDQHLDTYLNPPPGPLAKRARRVERSLTDYVYRTAVKTSPFSTLTGLALGEFRTTGGGFGPRGRISEKWTTYPRLNVAALGRIADLVVAHDGLRQDLPVDLVTGWRRDSDRIRYVRRKVTTGDDDAAVSFDSVREHLFFLRHGDTLGRIVTACREHPHLRYGDLVTLLAAGNDVPAEDYDRFLALLMRLGLLQVPSLGTRPHTPDPPRAFRDAVAGLGTPWAERLAGLLSGPPGVIDRYPAAGLAGRRDLLAALRRELSAAQESLGTTAPALPRTLLYEDTRCADEPLVCDRERWADTVGASLEAYARIVPVFDTSLPQRLLLKSFFLARFGRGGRCEDLPALVHDFQEDIYEQYARVTARYRPFAEDGSYTPLDNWLDSPGIQALDRARQELAVRMRALRDTCPDGGEEVVLGTAALDAVAAALPRPEAHRLPLSHFLQLTERAGEPLAVLNRTWGALAFPFSRFTHCFPDHGPAGLAGAVRAANRGLLPDGAVFAELTGGFATTNLNLHGRLTDYELLCPGESGSAPPGARIPLDDLRLDHDPDTDRLVLRSARLGREIVPVYLGYLVPMALPEIPRTLLLLSPSAFPVLDWWGGVPAGETPAGITARPRVRHGHVVLSRRSWSLPAGLLPVRRSGATDAQWFLDWQEWRHRNGIPEQVFATVRAPGDGPGRTTRGKPQYLDFASLLALAAFEAGLKDPAAHVVLREALPGEDDARLASGDGRHVTELIVETHQGRCTP
ncbi:lantibiotic dehydratase [Streptomyces eurocidicus]|nr:lantibiotic dehydratase [Streptomyces eurocidicus]